MELSILRYYKYTLTFFIACITKCFPQISTYTLNSNEDVFFANHSKNTYKVFLIGEYHQRKFNFNIEVTYWNALNKRDIYPNYILLEDGPSRSYLLNKYLATGNEEILSVLDIWESEKEISRKIREYYLTLSENNKFHFYGVDVDRYTYLTHYAIRDILLSYSNPPSKFSDIIHSFQSKDNPIMVNQKSLEIDINNLFAEMEKKDSLLLREYLRDSYEYLKQFRKAYLLNKEAGRYRIDKASKEFKTKREWFMINNIYNLFLKDSAIVCIGRFGSFHVQLNNNERLYNECNDISMAAILNTDKKFFLTNGKINSNLIVYSNAYPKHYKFVKTNVNDIKNSFKLLPNNSIQIKEYEDKTYMTNLILLKTNKK